MDSCSDSSTSDLEMLAEMNLAAAIAVILADTTASEETSPKYKGGSKLGRAGNRDFEVKEKHAQLDFDFFCRYSNEELVFTEEKF